VAEVRTGVQSTTEHFTAIQRAEMLAIGISSPANTLFNITAHEHTLMSLARLDRLADLLALEVVNSLDLFFRHQLLTLFNRVILFVARFLHGAFTTFALDLDGFLADHTGIAMACLHTLVSSARKELLTVGSTGRDLLSAGSTLAAQKLRDFVMARGAV